MEYKLTGSIVAYKNKPEVLLKSIQSFLNTSLPVKLFIVDNSPDDRLKNVIPASHTEYLFNKKNVGFGKGHNVAIKRAWKLAKYHLVLNPDVYFGNRVLERLFTFMENNSDVGLVTPKILNPDGSTQHLCKLLPTPIDLFLRRFLGFNKKLNKKNNYHYEMQFTKYNRVMEVPYVSGCFMFLRNEALRKAGLFDERIFLYIEDADLTRRIHKDYRTLFLPEVSIYHHYAKGSYKSFKLMLYHIHGAFQYFNKWGWFFDRERNRINKNILTAHFNEI